MEQIMNKLVRDKIIDIIINNGDIPTYHILDEKEYIEALKLKLNEEYQEILKAKTKEEILEESSDLLEVLCALIKAIGYQEEDLSKMRTLKREKRGGFDKRIYLEKTSSPN